MDAIASTKGELTRARIVEAAYALFLEQGFHGTSMRQIVDAAGITMGGVYNHFASKEALWQAVLLEKHPYREIVALLEQAQGDTVAAFVRNGALGIVDTLGHRPDVLKLMFIEMVEFGGRHVPVLFEAVLPRVARLRRVLLEKRGPLRPIPLSLLARAYGGLIFSYYVTNLFLPPAMEQPMGNAALDGFIDIFLYGILAAPEGNHD